MYKVSSSIVEKAKNGIKKQNNREDKIFIELCFI